MRIGVRLAAACLLAAAAGVVPASSASAATCSSADGVSVVVDFHELGGGVRSECVVNGGGDYASSLFKTAGFSLTPVQGQAGFVCRVNGAPSNDPCNNTPPADAYWGLWWSDGTSGEWTYALRGVSSQRVPDGGYVAFSWNGSAARSYPGVSPTAHPAAPTPTSKPSTKPSTKPTKKPSSKPTAKSSSTSTQAPGSVAQPTRVPDDESGQMVPQSPTPTPSSGASPTGSTSISPPPAPSLTPVAPTPSDTPSETSDAAPAASDPADPADGGLPTWVGPVVILVLFAAGGTVAVVRRRGTPSP